jgi:DNA-binding response OmpR family regulator
MARVLLVDDDPSLLDVLAMAFADAGHAVETAPDGRQALALLKAGAFDLVVSDVVMPALDGLTLVRRLREAGDAIPVLLLTSRDTELDEALGLELGADDYVAKPFSTRILLARVAALLRRQAARAKAEHGPVVRAGELTLDAERLEARWREAALVLTLTEFRMLEALARRPGIVLGRDRLLELARGDDSVVDARLVDTYVRRLRRKLEAAGATGEPIETVVGAGYRWRA